MFGYACDETPELMPFPIQMAHNLVSYLAKIRKGGEAPFIKPDSKSQVTVDYQDGRPVRVSSVVISTQHSREVNNETLRETVIDGVIRAVIPAEYLDQNTIFHVNPTGRSRLGDLRETAASLAERSSWIPMAAWGATVGVRFQAKTPPR